jgi:hypothetical protein
MGSRWWKLIPADLTTGTMRYRKRTYSTQIILPIDICHLLFFLRKDSVDPGALLVVSTCRECCSRPPRRSRDSMVDCVAFLRVAHGRKVWGIAKHVVSPPHMADRCTSTDSRFIGPLPSLNRLDPKWVHQFSSHFKHLHSPQGTLVGIR